MKKTHNFLKLMKKNGFYRLKSPDIDCGDDWFLHLLTADEIPIHIVISLGSNKPKHLKYINVTVWKEGCLQEIVIYSKDLISFSSEIDNKESTLWSKIWSFCNAFGYKTEGITINYDNEQIGNWNLM